MLQYLAYPLFFAAELLAQPWWKVSNILSSQTGCEIFDLRRFQWILNWWHKGMSIRLELVLLLGIYFLAIYLYFSMLLFRWKCCLHTPMEQIVPRPLAKLPLEFPHPVLEVSDYLLLGLPVHHSKLYCKISWLNTTWSSAVRVTSRIGPCGGGCRPRADWPCDRPIRERQSWCRGEYRRRCALFPQRRLWSLCACS